MEGNVSDEKKFGLILPLDRTPPGSLSHTRLRLSIKQANGDETLKLL